MKPLGSKIRDRIRTLFGTGRSAPEIAAELSLAKTTVYRLLRNAELMDAESRRDPIHGYSPPPCDGELTGKQLAVYRRGVEAGILSCRREKFREGGS